MGRSSVIRCRSSMPCTVSTCNRGGFAYRTRASRQSAKPGRRSDAMRDRIRAGDNHHFPHPDESNAQFIDPRALSKAVDALLPADRVVASNSGHFCGWVPRYLRVPNARASCLSHSFQSVGLGLPSVIGLAVANPGKLAVLGAGDGGFMMSISDFETAIRLKLRLCVLLYTTARMRRRCTISAVRVFRPILCASRRPTLRPLPAATARCGDPAHAADLAPVKAGRRGAPGVFVIDGKITNTPCPLGDASLDRR